MRLENLHQGSGNHQEPTKPVVDIFFLDDFKVIRNTFQDITGLPTIQGIACLKQGCGHGRAAVVVVVVVWNKPGLAVKVKGHFVGAKRSSLID